jgi:hypothetical protein
MFPEKREVLWAFAGNLVVGFGAGTATLAAFAPSLPLFQAPPFVLRVLIVSIGFAFFFAGYHITQAGTYRDLDKPIVHSLAPIPASANELENKTEPSRVYLNGVVALRGFFVVLGVVALGAGMRLFAIAIESWDPRLGVLTGVVCIGGYISGHIGLNWMLI